MGLAILLAFIGIFIIGSTDIYAAEDWDIYINEKWGYGLEYPTGWEVAVDVENPAGPERVVRQRVVFRGPEGAAIFVSVWEKLSPIGLEEWFGRFRKASWGELEGLPRKAESKVAGSPALFFEIPASSQAVGEWVAFFGGEGRWFEVAYEIRDRDVSWPVFQAICDSFTVFDWGLSRDDNAD